MTNAPSVAYQLATIDCRCKPSSLLVARYQRVLTTLVMRKCKESKRMLGDMAVRSVELLGEEGIRVTNLKMLRLVNQSIPNSIGFKQPCLDIFAALVTLMSD